MFRSFIPITLPAALLGACTLNVRVDTFTDEATYDGEVAVIRVADGPEALLVVDGTGDAGIFARAEGHVVTPEDAPPRYDAGAGWIGFEQDGDAIEVVTSTDVTSSSTITLAALHLRAPATTSLDLATGSGNVVVASMEAPVTVTADSGDVAVQTGADAQVTVGSGHAIVFAETATVSADSGSLLVDARGPSAVHSDSGSIDAFLASGGSVSTDSGHVQVVLGGGGWIATDSGDVDATLLPGTSSTFDGLSVSTDSGSITLAIPYGAGFAFALSTDSGNVSIDAHQTNAGHGLVLVNGGGPLVTCATDSGDVRILER